MPSAHSLFSSYPVRKIIRKHPSFPTQIPEILWKLENPPDALFVQGSEAALNLFTLLPEAGLAIVGTRNPQPRSLNLVQEWVKKLAGSELVILSGLALGIDAAAHSAALNAGLKTIAFLGAGHHLNYPRENQELRNRILSSGGLVISEYPPEAPALKHHFLKRNQMIAAWSKATWVVEAGVRSGALNTARWARDHDRLCFAVPGFPGDVSLAGNQLLLDRDHALPTWGVHSLGAAWLKLATYSAPHSWTEEVALDLKGGTPSVASEGPDLLLYRHLKGLTLQSQGASLNELFEWASQQNWESQQLFLSLKALSQKKRIREQYGIWFVLHP